MRPRRFRCVGPVCNDLESSLQLHERTEMVRLSDGRRVCTTCALAIAAKTQPDAVERIANLLSPETSSKESEIEVQAGAQGDTQDALTESLTDVDWVEKLDGEPAPLFIPALSVQADLGDPLEYVRFPDYDIPGWPLRKGRLSASSISSFLTCPEKFRRQQILGEREPTSGPAVAGGAAHKAVEANYLHMMMQGTPAPEEMWQEWLNAKFDKEADDVQDWGKRGFGAKDPFTKDEVRERARMAAGAYIRTVSPHVRPVAVEQPFLTWIEGCPVPIVGVKDLVTPDSIVDLKFGGKVHQEMQGGWRLQGLIYLLTDDLDMTWHSIGWPKKDGSVGVAWPAMAPGLRMRRTYTRFSIGADLVRSTVKSIMAYARDFGVDNAWPSALTQPFACDWCYFRKIDACPWWHRSVSAEDLL